MVSLSKRTILVVVSTFIALQFILAAITDVALLNSYKQIENEHARATALSVRRLIDDRIDHMAVPADYYGSHLGTLGNDRAALTLAVQKQVTESLMQLHHVDLVALYDSENRRFFIQCFDCGNKRFCPVEPGVAKDLDTFSGRLTSVTDSDFKGLVSVAGSPLMVSYKRLQRSGALLIVGCYLDNDEIARIARVTGTSIDIHSLDDSDLARDVKIARNIIGKSNNIHSQIVDHSRVSGYFTVSDLFKSPAFIVRVSEKAQLLAQGKMSITFILLTLFVTGLVFCLVVVIFIRGAILQRIALLCNKLRTISSTGDISSRLDVRDKADELEDLAHSINGMLDSLESSEKTLRESEERYRALFERAPDAIIIIGMDDDEAGRIIAANQVAAEQHGYTVDELCRLAISDLNTPETNQVAGEMMAQLAMGEWIVREVWHRKKDGTFFPIEVHAGMIRFQGRRYVLGFDRDITSRKMSEETDRMYLDQIRHLNLELNRKASELAAANTELETFNYSVSHDMRGPLTRVSGYCQLILDEFNDCDPQVLTYVARMYEASSWLNEMIEAMLNLAQLSRAEFVQERVDLSSIACEIFKELALTHPERSVDISVVPDAQVDGDTKLLKILMTNLLNNAWKYSVRTSDAHIEFGIDSTVNPPVYFVRDNGAGFDMVSADKLFRVFTRLHDTADFPGSGIGLATVQRIVNRHSGRIWAEAVPGKGACFYFTLQAVPQVTDV